MASLKLFIESGSCTVSGQIPTIFKLVESIPETKGCRILFRETQIGNLSKERYDTQKIGKTHENYPIKMVTDGEERWMIEYEVIKVEDTSDNICAIRRVFYKGEVLYILREDYTKKSTMLMQF